MILDTPATTHAHGAGVTLLQDGAQRPGPAQLMVLIPEYPRRPSWDLQSSVTPDRPGLAPGKPGRLTPVPVDQLPTLLAASAAVFGLAVLTAVAGFGGRVLLPVLPRSSGRASPCPAAR